MSKKINDVEVLEAVNRVQEFKALLNLQMKANGKQFSLSPCPDCHTNELLYLDVVNTQVRCLRCGHRMTMDPTQLIANAWGTSAMTPAMKYCIETKPAKKPVSKGKKQ